MTLKAITNDTSLQCPCKRGVLLLDEGVYTCSRAECRWVVYPEIDESKWVASQPITMFCWYTPVVGGPEVDDAEEKMRQAFIRGIHPVTGCGEPTRDADIRCCRVHAFMPFVDWSSDE